MKVGENKLEVRRCITTTTGRRRGGTVKRRPQSLYGRRRIAQPI